MNSSSAGKKKAYVYADWLSTDTPILMGILCEERLRNRQVVSFEYDDSWLESGLYTQLDPDLHLFAGRQYLPSEKPSFAVFLDSAPDRWGRTLMKRREAYLARKETRRPHPFSEFDYLLGVDDAARMGALRFKKTPDGPFESETGTAVPPWKRLRELEYASLEVEEGENSDEWLKLLIAPGSSLGGARPKASISSESGELWIAKFPSKNDDIDAGAWEYLTSQLARDAGLRVPPSHLMKFSTAGHTFLTRRFDRTKTQKRIHFASAMTLLGKQDGSGASDGTSYLEIAEVIRSSGAQPAKDLDELFRRIIFNVAVSNTDDHLRNHGFLLSDQGWILSPLYDVNPDPFGNGLTLNISPDDNALDFDLVIEQAPFYDITRDRAWDYVKKTLEVISSWRSRAKALRLQQNQIHTMQGAWRES